MSSIGKIFTVLNLVLAAAFLGWAANALKSNAEWKQKYEATTVELSKAKALMSEETAKLGAAKQTAEQSVARLTTELANANNDKERLNRDLADWTQKGSTMQTSLTTISTTLQGIEAEKGKLQGDKDKAEKAQRDAEAAKTAAETARDEADKMANGLKGDLDKANNMIADLEKAKTTLQKDRSGLETQLATLVANTGAKVTDFAPVPDIPAAVLDVSMAVEPGLVALNVGSSKGVVRGYTFEIYDGKTYKGQARVEFLHADMCSAIITRKVAGQTIRQGDQASTRL